jgi:hypothetical protein
VLDGGQLGGGRRRERREQPGSRGGGHGEHHRVASYGTGAAADPAVSRQPVAVRASARTVVPSSTRAPDRAASAAGSRPRPPGSEANSGPSVGGVADRASRAASSRLRCRPAAATSCGSVARSDSRSGRPGVDAAEQRLDQPVDHLAAEAPGDQLPHGHVVGDRPARQQQVQRHAVQAASGQQPAAGERGQVGRQPEQRPGGQRPERAAAPDEGRAGGGGDELVLQAAVAGQRDAVRHPGQHRVGALVDGQPADLAHGHLAADPRGALEHRHPGPAPARLAAAASPATPPPTTTRCTGQRRSGPV